MEPILDIPAPEAGDTETVVSSLETAAIFGAKGDAAEALRWVQRAAESAGESGDDARTLTLARTVASISSRLNGAAELEDRRLPTPPSRPTASPGDEDAKPFMLESRSRPEPPSSRPTATSTPPPPPSARAHPPTPDKPSAPSVPTAAPKGVTPSPPTAASKSVTPSPPTASASAFKSVVPATRPSAASPARASSLPPQLPKTSNGASTTNGARPASKSVTPSVLGAPPAAASASKSATPEGPVAATGAGRARQAARVSVTRSLTERGLYFVRVLDEGQAVPDDAFEGLLVSNDANQTLV